MPARSPAAAGPPAGGRPVHPGQPGPGLPTGPRPGPGAVRPVSIRRARGWAGAPATTCCRSSPPTPAPARCGRPGFSL